MRVGRGALETTRYANNAKNVPAIKEESSIMVFGLFGISTMFNSFFLLLFSFILRCLNLVIIIITAK